MADKYNGYVIDQWDDLRVPLEATRINPVSSKPDYGTFISGTMAFLFDASDEESVTFACQLPHSWVEGDTIKPHVHWAATDTGAGTVIWGLEYTMAAINGTFGATTAIEASANASGVANKHQVTGLGSITMAGKKISTMLVCRLYRKAATDTYGSDAACLEIDFHFRKNSMGSSGETTK